MNKAVLSTLVLSTVSILSCAQGEAPPVASSAKIDPKADALVRGMSELMANAQRFAFRTVEWHDRVSAAGEKKRFEMKREIAVRRPDGLWFRFEGDRHDGYVVYDGKHLSLVTDTEKMYARAPMAPTLDEMIEIVGERASVRMPMADLLLSNPYQSLVDEKETTGRYVGAEAIDGRTCHHVAYQHPAVDFDLWIQDGEKPFPCRLDITYKNDDGAPQSSLRFSDWDIAPRFGEDRFAFAAPEGYTRIRFAGQLPAGKDSASPTPGPTQRSSR